MLIRTPSPSNPPPTWNEASFVELRRRSFPGERLQVFTVTTINQAAP
jgi:hypothetical protein